MNRRLRETISSRFDYQELVGNSSSILKLKDVIARLAPTDVTVLIQGETGSAKELVAKAIHHLSARSGAAFVAVDCAPSAKRCSKANCSGT